MDALFWFNVFTRWLHVTCAVVGVGALVCLGLVLLPALGEAEAGVRQAVMARLLPRLKRLLHLALGLLLVTGFYNFYLVMPKVKSLDHRGLYQPIIGTKILLALVLFGMVTALLSSVPPSAALLEKRSGWVSLLIALALVILFLSAILRRLWV